MSSSSQVAQRLKHRKIYLLSRADLIKISVDGFVFIKTIPDDTATLVVASAIGEVINLHHLDCAYPDSFVDILTPKNKSDKNLNRYHGNYGYEDYPMHTDLAQWARPPRYLMLRGTEGNPDVSTLLIDAPSLARILPISLAKRAVFLPRNIRTNVALSFILDATEKLAIRWDPLFLRPLNSAAQDIVAILQSHNSNKFIKGYSLTDCKSILIIDNWRCLHGRGVVVEGDCRRSVERIYLERLYGNAG